MDARPLLRFLLVASAICLLGGCGSPRAQDSVGTSRIGGGMTDAGLRGYSIYDSKDVVEADPLW